MEIMALNVGLKLDDKAAIVGLQGVDRAGKTATASLNLGIKQAAQALTALGLEAKVVAVGGIDRITVSAKNLDQANLILAKMGRGLSAVSVEALRAARATDQVAVAAQRVEQVAVRANTNVAASSGVATRRYQTAALQISGTLVAISQAGDSSATHIARLISLGSGVAFAFGPTGAIVGAVGMVAVAIVNMFTRARTEMEETRKKYAEELGKMQDAGDRAGLMAQGAAIFQGTPSKNFVDGLKNMRAELENLAKAPKIAESLGLLPAARENLARMEGLGSEPWAAAMQRLARERVKDLETNLGPRVRELLDLIKAAEDQLAKVQKALLGGKPWSQTERPAIEAVVPEARAPTVRRPSTAMQDTTRLTVGQRLHRPSEVEDPFSGAGMGPQLLKLPGSVATAVANNMKDAQADLQAGLENPVIAAMSAAQDAIGAAVDRFSGGIGDALHAGFAAAFSGGGIGGLLKGFTSGILGSLGNMFIELGKHFLFFGTIMTALKEKLSNFFTSGPASIVAGIALIALGSAMTAGAGAIMSGGRAGGGGAATVATRSFGDRLTTRSIGLSTVDMNGVTPLPPRVINITVIGPDDPRAQRDIKRLIRNADDRGL